MSCSCRRGDKAFICPFPTERLPLSKPSFTRPLLLPSLRFMMSLSRLKSSGLFYLLRMCWALKVKPLCLWVPDCLSILCVCFSVSALPIKAQLPSAFWEITIGRRPPTKCLILVLPIKTAWSRPALICAHVFCITALSAVWFNLHLPYGDLAGSFSQFSISLLKPTCKVTPTVYYSKCVHQMECL